MAANIKFKSAFKTLFVLLVAFVALCSYQMFKVASASDTARHLNLEEWEHQSNLHTAFVVAYKSECEHSAVSLGDKKIMKPITFIECAEQLAQNGTAERVGVSKGEALDLAKAMALAADRVHVPAPLRWL